MSRWDAPPFLRGKSAGGFMSAQTREERCQLATLRELTRLIASKKFQSWAHDKASLSAVLRSRCWTAAFVLLVCLSFFAGRHLLALSSELEDARELLFNQQEGNMNGAAAAARKLEGQLKRQREENTKLLMEVKASAKRGEALLLNVQELKAQLHEQAQEHDTKVHDMETQEVRLKQEADRLAKELEQQKQMHRKKMHDADIREIQMKQEAERLAQLLAEEKRSGVELRDAQLKNEAQRLAKEGKEACLNTQQDDPEEEEAAKRVAMVRKFFLWCCITMAALAACGSGNILQRRRQLAQEFGVAMARPLPSRSDGQVADDGPEPITPTVGRKARGAKGMIRKRHESERPGAWVVTKRGSCEMAGTEVQAVLSDLSLNFEVQKDLEAAKKTCQDKEKQLQEKEALGKENMKLLEEEEKAVETVSMTFELRSNMADEMVLPEDMRDHLPAFHDDALLLSAPTTMGMIGDSEMPAGLFNERFASLERLGTGVANYEDEQNGGQRMDCIEDDAVPSHGLGARPLNMLLDSSGVRCT